MKTKLLTIFLLSTIICSGQNENTVEQFKPAVLKLMSGAKIVFNGTTHAFTIDVISDSIKPPERPNFLLVNNNVFQYLTLAADKRVNFDSLSIERKKANLTNYMNYELDYFKNELKIKISNLNFEWLELNKRLFLFWFFDMPKNNKTIEKQVYLTTICYDNIVGLNMVMTRKGNSFNYYKNLLIGTGKTLQTFNEPINLDKLYKELNN